MKKFILITGANSGIGLTTVNNLLSKDLLVVALDKDISNISKINDKRLITVKGDVRNYNDIESAVILGENNFGKLDTIINNAGVMILETAEMQNIDDANEMVDTNYKGVIYGTQIALKRMISRKEGTIINVASTAGIKSYPNHAVYVGTKFAVRGFTDTVREEVSHSGVRVSLISPGVVKTNLLSRTRNQDIIKNYEEWRDATNAFVNPEDISKAILYIMEQPKTVEIRELVVTATTQAE